MILAVALNPALDVTYRVATVRAGVTHRVHEVNRRAGGKAVNVARVAQALGREALVTGLVGGQTGGLVCRDLDRAGIAHHFVPVAAETRSTVTVVDESAGDATVFNEPGPPVSSPEWLSFLTAFPELVHEAAVLVLSGSLPPGLPADAYATLTKLAQVSGTAVIVDAEGDALLAAAAAAPAIVKPNLDELCRTTGIDDPFAAAVELRDRGAEAVVATMGAQGAIAVTGDGSWRGGPPEHVEGNPTGAGDAFAAALAGALSDNAPWPVALAESVAASAASVRCPYAGDIDLEAHRRFRASTTVEELDGPGRDG